MGYLEQNIFIRCQLHRVEFGLYPLNIFAALQALENDARVEI